MCRTESHVCQIMSFSLLKYTSSFALSPLTTVYRTSDGIIPGPTTLMDQPHTVSVRGCQLAHVCYAAFLLLLSKIKASQEGVSTGCSLESFYFSHEHLKTPLQDAWVAETRKQMPSKIAWSVCVKVCALSKISFYSAGLLQESMFLTAVFSVAAATRLVRSGSARRCELCVYSQQQPMSPEPQAKQKHDHKHCEQFVAENVT